MFCQYDELRGLCKGRFSTFWLAGDKIPKKAKGRIQYHNADVISACNALLGIARMRSPPFEWVSPQLRLPTPRPKLTFTMMAIFLKGITFVHRYQSFVLYDSCKVMVADVFNSMMEPAPTDISIVEIDEKISLPTMGGKMLAIEPAKVDAKIGKGVKILDKNSLREMKMAKAVTMVENDYPRPQPDSFDGKIAHADKGFDLSELASIIETIETSCHGIRGLSQPTQDPQQEPNVMELLPEEPTKIPDQGAPEQMRGRTKRCRPDEDSMKTASISLLSSPPKKRKKRSAPVQPRRRLPMKIFIRSFPHIANYRRDKTHLRNLKISEFWEDQMAAVPLKVVKELVHTPLLPICHTLSITMFSLRVEKHSKDLHRFKLGSPLYVSPQSNERQFSKGAGPSGVQQPGLATPNPGVGRVTRSSDCQHCTLAEVPEGSQVSVSSQGRNTRGHSDIVQDEAVKAVKRKASLKEEPAKRSRLNLTTSIVSEGRLWDRALLREKISHLWAAQGSPISFYDICPEKVTSAKTAAKVLSALLDLHMKKVLILEQEDLVICTPILIYQPEA